MILAGTPLALDLGKMLLADSRLPIESVAPDHWQHATGSEAWRAAFELELEARLAGPSLVPRAALGFLQRHNQTDTMRSTGTRLGGVAVLLAV
jgi:hypothetical protein